MTVWTRVWSWALGRSEWNYTREIQAWKSDTPLKGLPPVKPLKAEKVEPVKSNVAQFSKRFL